MTEQKSTSLVDVNFVGWLQDLYDWLAGKVAAEGERRKKVYEAVSKAFFETRNLVENKVGSDNEIPRDARDKLSEAWQNAALQVREDFPEMYERFFEKAKYWQNPGDKKDYPKMKEYGDRYLERCHPLEMERARTDREKKERERIEAHKKQREAERQERIRDGLELPYLHKKIIREMYDNGKSKSIGKHV